MTRSFTSVVAGLGGSIGIAEICLVSKNTAASWVRRGAIPVRVWPSLLSSDRGRKLGLTSDELVALHAAPEASTSATVDAEDAA